jgi:hypothetical protein
MSENFPFPGATRETTIRVDPQGGFWHDGQPVTHPGLARAFAKWVDVDAESGRYILRNDINWAFITVDYAPLVARAAAVDGDGVLLSLSDGESERLDVATLRLEPGDVPYCDVRGGKLPAKLLPGAAYVVLDWLGDREVRRVASGEGKTRRG